MRGFPSQETLLSFLKGQEDSFAAKNNLKI